MYITKQEQTHRYREQTTGYQWGEGRGRGRYGWGMKRYKLLCIKDISYKDVSYNTGNIVNIL